MEASLARDGGETRCGERGGESEQSYTKEEQLQQRDQRLQGARWEH